MADNSKLNALLMLMALESMRTDSKRKPLSPFTISIEVTPASVSCSASGNRGLIEAVGGEEWLKETRDKVSPIMKEQTTKFSELMEKKLGLLYKSAL